jgi:hypothetical protein
MRLLVIALTMFVAEAAVLAQSPMRPGKWEVSTQMEMPGAPMQMPPMKMTRCVTAEEANDPANTVQGPERGDCKVSDYQMTGNTATWKMACTKPQAMSGTAEMTFSGDAYNGVMKMSTSHGPMSMKLSGKRVGDCDK